MGRVRLPAHVRLQGPEALGVQADKTTVQEEESEEMTNIEYDSFTDMVLNPQKLAGAIEAARAEDAGEIERLKAKVNDHDSARQAEQEHAAYLSQRVLYQELAWSQVEAENERLRRELEHYRRHGKLDYSAEIATLRREFRKEKLNVLVAAEIARERTAERDQLREALGRVVEAIMALREEARAMSIPEAIPEAHKERLLVLRAHIADVAALTAAAPLLAPPAKEEKP